MMIVDGRGSGTDVPHGMKCFRSLSMGFSSTKRDRRVIHQCFFVGVCWGYHDVGGFLYQSLSYHKLNIIITVLWFLQSWPWLPVITGDFNGIIHSINGVLLVLITGKWP